MYNNRQTEICMDKLKRLTVLLNKWYLLLVQVGDTIVKQADFLFRLTSVAVSVGLMYNEHFFFRLTCVPISVGLIYNEHLLE